jgi:hypothetical protein
MARNMRVPVYVGEEWHKALAALAGTFGVSAEEVIRRSLPDEAVIGLFFQCRDYIPGLRWDEVADVGRTAIREHLRAKYLKGLEEHLARLGVSLQSSADEVEAAARRALAEMQADPARPSAHQIAQAREDAVYLGYLYDAWRRAKAGQPGYAIAQVDLGATTGSTEPAPAVLRDNQLL